MLIILYMAYTHIYNHTMVFAEARIHCVNLSFIMFNKYYIDGVHRFRFFFIFMVGSGGWGSYSAHWDMAMWIPELYRWARIFS